jgi:hypothetical protein
MEIVAVWLFGLLYGLVLLVYLFRTARGSFRRLGNENVLLLGLIVFQLLLLDAGVALKTALGLIIGLVFAWCLLLGEKVRQRG